MRPEARLWRSVRWGRRSKRRAFEGREGDMCFGTRKALCGRPLMLLFTIPPLCECRLSACVSLRLCLWLSVSSAVVLEPL